MADLSAAETITVHELHGTHCRSEQVIVGQNRFGSSEISTLYCGTCCLELWPKFGGIRADIQSGINTGPPELAGWQRRVLVPRFPLRQCGWRGCDWQPAETRDELMASDDDWRVRMFSYHYADQHHDDVGETFGLAERDTALIAATLQQAGCWAGSDLDFVASVDTSATEIRRLTALILAGQAIPTLAELGLLGDSR